MAITEEMFLEHRRKCPVVCQGFECSYTNCPFIYWCNIAAEEEKK
jgi:hypothetical protein